LNIKEALKLSKTWFGFLNRGSVKKAQAMLLPSEDVSYAMNANVAFVPITETFDINSFKTKDPLNGILVITNERLYFANAVLGLSEFKSMNLKDIIAVDEKSGRLGFASINVQGATEVFAIECTTRTAGDLRSALNSAMSHVK